MANFKDKMKDKKTIGNRIIDSDEALNLSFSKSDKTIITVKLNCLVQNPYQPRKTIFLDKVSELSKSIEEDGLLQPILISSINQNPNKFYIVAGHRRVLAYKELKKDSIEAIIIDSSEEDLKIYSIVENLQREEISGVEEAFAIAALAETGLKQVDIAKRLGKDKAYISKSISITKKMDPELIEYMKTIDAKLTSTLLYELTSIEQSKQLEAFKHLVKKSLNRDSFREYAKSLKEGNKEKVSPAQLFNGFSMKNNKNQISFKLDLNKLEDKQEAISALEDLLIRLRTD